MAEEATTTMKVSAQGGEVVLDLGYLPQIQDHAYISIPPLTAARLAGQIEDASARAMAQRLGRVVDDDV